MEIKDITADIKSNYKCEEEKIKTILNFDQSLKKEISTNSVIFVFYPS